MAWCFMDDGSVGIISRFVFSAGTCGIKKYPAQTTCNKSFVHIADCYDRVGVF